MNERLRTVLVLGRVSNLPTVWSNCLAAWLLGGGGQWSRFVWLCAGATLLYTGGMFLNDACDQQFDRQYRSERPIVSGRISARTVWVAAFLFLFSGWLLILPLGQTARLLAAGLAAVIVIYDVIHKQTVLAPLLMAACRFLLYLVAGAAAQGRIGPGLWWPAGALAFYIVGLSYLARGESTKPLAIRWPLPLLFVPLITALVSGPRQDRTFWMVLAGQGAWVLWCLWGTKSAVRVFLRQGVAGLLAGIVLVDWLAVTRLHSGLNLVFFSLFFLALVFQRVAPAT